jgi:sodium/hydrogen antiporter
MQAFDPAAFTHLLALLGLVIILASLVSGAIERLGVPAVAVFLCIGALLGPHGLGLLDFGLSSATLGAIATLSLVLVLFTDSVTLNLKALRTHVRLATTVLGPGTLIPALLTAVAAWWLLELPPAAAAILGAALSSTDPVMVRGLLRLAEVPGAARTALSIESGLNDAVLLPIVLLASVILSGGGVMPPMGEIAKVAGEVLLLGPLAGVLVGFLAVKAMEWFRGWFGMRRDYESLYVLGVAFTAYAAAEALHGSGFMAAFAAGLTIAATDVELCDCFHEYGEATAEMLLLLGFIAFGASLVWSGLTVLSAKTLLFALVALGGRAAVLYLALPRRGLDPVARRLIVWYGPRALSSFLLVLIPVFLGIANSEQLFPVTALVVLLSVTLHGALLVWATHWLKRRPETEERPVAGLPGAELVAHPELITFEELEALKRAGYAVHLLDVRTDKSWEGSEAMGAGAIRLPPARPTESAAALALPRQDWLVAYCA